MILILKKIAQVENEAVVDAEIKSFVQINSKNLDLNVNLNRNDSIKLWNKVFAKLELFLSDPYLYADVISNYIQTVKILSRDPNQVEYLNEPNWISSILEVVTKYYANIDFEIICLESLKCLCNLVFQSNQIRLIFLKLSAFKDIFYCLHKLRVDTFYNSEIPLYLEKLLFLVTALLKESRSRLLLNSSFFYEITEILESLTKKLYESDESANIQTYLETSEVLKMLFTITSTEDTKVDEQCELNILEILKDVLLMKKHPGKLESSQQSVKNHIIELILNFDNDRVVNTILNDQRILSLLLEILNARLNEIGESDQVTLVSPVISVLLRACKSNRSIRKYYRKHILPPLRDFSKRPEQGSAIRNKLCRLLTLPDVMIKDLAAEFLFVLCKENVARMIKYTGYGNAAGLLARRGFSASNHLKNYYSSGSDNSETEEYLENKSKINPVTGCYEEPKANLLANMTDEQKEYEALKLVNMIDGLMRNGIIKPCTMSEDGKPVPVEHVLQFHDQKNQ